MTDVKTPAGAGVAHLSHSSVADYAKCGHGFWLKKFQHVPQEPSWALLGGGAVHAVTETLDYSDFGIDNGGPKDFQEALDLQIEEQRERGWGKHQIKTTGRKSKDWPEARNEKYWREIGPGHVTRWRSFLRTGMDIAIIGGKPAIEVEFLVEVAGPDGGVPFKGYIDRVLTNPVYGAGVVDLKSGSRPPTSGMQLREYDLALRLLDLDIEVRWASYYLTQEGGGLTAPTDLTVLSDDQVKAPILSAWKGIRAGVFTPNIGDHCRTCFVRSSCEWRNA